MADWQMRKKRPLRGPRPEPAGPTLKNYITPAGLKRKTRHLFLMSRERPAVLEVVCRRGSRCFHCGPRYRQPTLRRSGQIDSRIRFLTKRIDAAVVVGPAAPRPGQPLRASSSAQS